MPYDRSTSSRTASIRYWYPHVPITLIKDESRGAYDTSDIETYWGVDCLQTGRRLSGFGMSKLEGPIPTRRSTLSDPGQRHRFPVFTFNTGTVLATTGLLRREDFSPHLTADEPPQLLRPDIFKAGEQGLLNYMVLRKMQMGELSVQEAPIQRWAQDGYPLDVALRSLKHGIQFSDILIGRRTWRHRF